MRFQAWDFLREDTDWNTFYAYLNYKCTPTKRETNPKYSTIKAFKIKLLLEELPTLDTLNVRDSQKYNSPTCTRYQNALENCYHVLTCTLNSTSLRKAITCAITKTLKKQQLYTEAKVPQITRIITNNIHLSDPYFPSMNRVILRILPVQATNEINKITQNAQKKPKLHISFYTRYQRRYLK